MIRYHNRRIFSFFFAMMLGFFSIAGWLVNPSVVKASSFNGTSSSYIKVAQDKAADSDKTSSDNPFGDMNNVLPSSRVTNWQGLAVNIINWLLGIAGALAVLALIYSGLMYITGGGDVAKSESNSAKIAQAKKNIIWAIIGIVIIILAFILVNEINQIL